MGDRFQIAAVFVFGLTLLGCETSSVGPSQDAGGPADTNTKPADGNPQNGSDASTTDVANEGGAPDVVSTDGRPDGAVSVQTCAVPRTGEPPAMLSATGCVDRQDPKKPAATLIPYDVNSPLWSDGAEKTRFMAIPDGKKLHIRDCAAEPMACDVNQGGVSEDGHIAFPVGSVLVKNFLIGGAFIETRLLAHTSEGFWKGFSYRWNDAGTDAMLIPDSTAATERQLTGQTWQFPSRAQCLQCHTEPAGRSLGPTVAQFNRDFDYPTGKMNQLTALETKGLLDAPLSKPPAMLPAYPNPAVTTVSLDERMRSYLHANCAICHRPGGTFSGMDMRYETPFAQRELCNVVPSRGTLNVANSRRLVPNDPARSIISLRMYSTAQEGMTRMPQIGSLIVDPLGTTIIDQWIRGVTACP